MPDRRQEYSGRRKDDPKKPAETAPPAIPVPPAGPPPDKQREEVEPNRSHPLHRKVGGKPKK